MDILDTPKKRGRPKKKNTTPKYTIYGVIPEPANENNHVEFVYHNPTHLKKILTLFKNMSGDIIQIVFSKQYIYMWCNSHTENSRAKVKIDCSKVSSYYCGDELDVGVLRDSLGFIMNTIKKSHNCVNILCRRDKPGEMIDLVMKNDEGMDATHNVELIGTYERISDEENRKFDDEDYTLKAEMPYKTFKELLGEAGTKNNKMTIRQESSTDQVYFELIQPDKKIKSYYPLDEKKNIQYKSSLSGDDTFRVSLNVDNLSLLKKTTISKSTIKLYISEKKPILSTIIIDDGVIEIKILTDIIDDSKISQN